MPKATLMVRFKRPADTSWKLKPASIGTTGRNGADALPCSCASLHASMPRRPLKLLA